MVLLEADGGVQGAEITLVSNKVRVSEMSNPRKTVPLYAFAKNRLL
jgi:hypothetical protein